MISVLAVFHLLLARNQCDNRPELVRNIDLRIVLGCIHARTY